MWIPKIKINLLPPLRLPEKRPRSIKDIWRKFRETDRAIHDRIYREFPRTVRIVDNILGAFLAIVSNPLFSIIVALILVPLVTSETISLVNALSIGGAWIVAVAWVARSAPLKDIPVPSRFLIVMLLAAILAVSGIKFGHWSTQKWEAHHKETAEPKHEESKKELPKIESAPMVLGVKPAPSKKETRPAEHPKPKPTSESPSAATQPEMGFHESTDVYWFTLGENGLSAAATVAGLRLGQKPFVGFPITVFAKDTDNKIHYQISIWNGMSPVEVTDDELSLHEPFWDRNFDKTALEVVDEKQAPVLQVMWKTPRNLVINGIFRLQNGSVVIADSNGWRPMKPGDKIRPLFKYPSRRFQGQYVD